MENSSPTVVYERGGCSVIAVPGQSKPSLVLTVEVAEQLCLLLSPAYDAAYSLPPSKKSEPIRQLCSVLQGVLANFGRGIIEWEAGLPLEPAQKAAAMEVLAAFQALECLQGNGPSNA